MIAGGLWAQNGVREPGRGLLHAGGQTRSSSLAGRALHIGGVNSLFSSSVIHCSLPNRDRDCPPLTIVPLYLSPLAFSASPHSQQPAAYHANGGALVRMPSDCLLHLRLLLKRTTAAASASAAMGATSQLPPFTPRPPQSSCTQQAALLDGR